MHQLRQRGGKSFKWKPSAPTTSASGSTASRPFPASISTFKKGAIFGLLGPNGAGKTTTLRMVMHILVPDSGDVRILEEPASEKTQDRIGYLPEERGLYNRMKVREVLVFLGALKGLPETVAAGAFTNGSNASIFPPGRRSRVRELSKGMQQKVQFIAAVFTRRLADSRRAFHRA